MKDFDNNKLYVFIKISVREKLLKRYYNNFLIKYFEINKTFELINKKYY